MLRHFFILFTFLAATSATANQNGIHTGFLSDLAVDGYDTVAFHTDGRAIRGEEAFETRWRDAVWRFSSAENLSLFLSNPEAYAPAYGGHCAWAAANGYTASGDPHAWAVVDGRLFLNFNLGVKRRWDVDRPGNIAAGDRNWPIIIGN